MRCTVDERNSDGNSSKYRHAACHYAVSVSLRRRRTTRRFATDKRAIKRRGGGGYDDENARSELE